MKAVSLFSCLKKRAVRLIEKFCMILNQIENKSSFLIRSENEEHLNLIYYNCSNLISLIPLQLRLSIYRYNCLSCTKNNTPK
jgi:hypothetical protein